MQIKDKKTIVIGAASSLGLAFSRELLRNGAAVFGFFFKKIFSHLCFL